jgi:ubiquinone/menaquinone biosynthesis C-methylase UbiE
MVLELKHALKPAPSPEDVARQRFVSGLRAFVLNDMANDMKRAYETRVKPAAERAGRKLASGEDVHAALRGDPTFTAYSALRVQAQKMVWDSVGGVVERDRRRLNEQVDALADKTALDPQLSAPRNVKDIDVHLMPGSYTGRGDPKDPSPGAIYDQGLAIFSFGLMGDNLDDIGRSMAAFVSARWPDFRPRKILDIGCTIGHNTLPWKWAYPEAEVLGVDAAAPGLRYGAARAALQNADVRFAQMDARALKLPDENVDLVFSSMFLHELPPEDVARTLKEARRVLRKGGMMLHMELPPNTQMSPYEGFYLDWDCFYNEEPYYKAYRDREPADLVREAGFQSSDYFQFVTPSLGGYGLDAIRKAARAEGLSVDSENTGRLADGIVWFGYGAWKS